MTRRQRKHRMERQARVSRISVRALKREEEERRVAAAISAMWAGFRVEYRRLWIKDAL